MTPLSSTTGYELLLRLRIYLYVCQESLQIIAWIPVGRPMGRPMGRPVGIQRPHGTSPVAAIPPCIVQ